MNLIKNLAIYIENRVSFGWFCVLQNNHFSTTTMSTIEIYHELCMCNKILTFHIMLCSCSSLFYLYLSLFGISPFCEVNFPIQMKYVWLRTVLEPVWVTNSVIWNRRVPHTTNEQSKIICSLVVFRMFRFYWQTVSRQRHHCRYTTIILVYGIDFSFLSFFFFEFVFTVRLLFVYLFSQTLSRSIYLSLCYPRYRFDLSVNVEVWTVRAIKSNPSNQNLLTDWYKHSKLYIIAHIYNIIYPQHTETIYTRIKLQPIELVYFIWLFSIWVPLLYQFLSSIQFYSPSCAWLRLLNWRTDLSLTHNVIN